MMICHLTKRQSRYVRAVAVEYGDDNWPDGNLTQMIEWFYSVLQDIPAEYRNTARCEISTVADRSDNNYASIEISYYRPETNAEMEERAARERAWTESQERKELALLEQLQRKYGQKQIPEPTRESA